MVASSPYRAFITYSHQDQTIFDVVSKALQSNGCRVLPWSDKDLSVGSGFTEQIQTNIAHSHVFVPILTRKSHERGWVHQEIGFASSTKVPCVPICVGRLPEGMIAMAHAVVVDDPIKLRNKLSRINFGQLVKDASRQWAPPMGCAREPEERAEMIEQLSEEAFTRFGPQCVRSQGSLSSFSLPDEPPDHPAWTARYGDKSRTQHAYGWFRRERQALERHAASAGVKLIINTGLDFYDEYGAGAQYTRLNVLVAFLESLSDEKSLIALEAKKHPCESLIAVGDWFIGESLAGRPVRGILQTVFTAHAPTVSREIVEFDEKLDAILATQKHPPGQSRPWVIEQLRTIMKKLPKHSMWSGY